MVRLYLNGMHRGPIVFGRSSHAIPHALKGSKMTHTNYEIFGWDQVDDTGATELQVTADYDSAIAWVEGYTRGGDLGGWVEILIQNDDAEAVASFDAYGWTYYTDGVAS